LNDQQDVTYDIAALVGTPTAATNVPKSTVTGNTADCVLTYTIEILDYPSNSWVEITQANATSKYTFIVQVAALDDPSTNTFDVQTINFATWANTTQNMRLRVRD
jgi:small ligand-binding sensory domain FIST